MTRQHVTAKGSPAGSARAERRSPPRRLAVASTDAEAEANPHQGRRGRRARSAACAFSRATCAAGPTTPRWSPDATLAEAKKAQRLASARFDDSLDDAGNLLAGLRRNLTIRGAARWPSRSA